MGEETEIEIFVIFKYYFKYRTDLTKSAPYVTLLYHSQSTNQLCVPLSLATKGRKSVCHLTTSLFKFGIDVKKHIKHCD